MSRTLLYVAYPMRLDLGAANAIQTYNTVRELQALVPDMRLVIPRWLNEPSAFTELGAVHLPRPAVHKLSRILPWGGWSYIERTLYSLMLVTLLVACRVTGHGYRVLYVRDTVCAAWLGLLRQLHGARIVYEVHDLEADHPSRASKWPRAFWARFLPWLDHIALSRANRIVSLTQTFKDWAVQKGVKKAQSIAVIPDAFDPDLYYPVDTGMARREAGLLEKAFVMGYAGLTFSYRNLDLLVEAFAQVAASNHDALLLLVGGRPQEVDELRTLAGKLHIPQEQIMLTGQVEQTRSALYVQCADVLAIPDTVTGMTASPLKLFEYMASGKPIICKDMPALREIVNEDVALFFEGGDVNSLAAGLRALMDDPPRRERMGKAALAQSAGYTYAARARRIAEVVRGVR
ncbi:MAG TPA: glycosyltransferase [Chloroflexia bacterium]|nr:glycosyltransferase [Chloroflexia bacterium]